MPRELLVVDGYNVLFKTPRYTGMFDEGQASGDPFERARELLIADVAAYAQGRFDAVIVFDGANNLSDERPVYKRAGIRIVFSAQGESADTVIERLVVESRLAAHDVTVITSDNTIRATVGGVPVTRLSSEALIGDVITIESDVHQANDERNHQKLTIEDRLDPKTRAKLNALLGRNLWRYGKGGPNPLLCFTHKPAWLNGRATVL